MNVDSLLDRFPLRGAADAVVWRGQSYSYRWLANRLDHWSRVAESSGIGPGRVVALEADYSPDSIATTLALARTDCIIALISPQQVEGREELYEIAQIEAAVSFDQDDRYSIRRYSRRASHELYQKLREQSHPGLVLWTSGSTGKSKAIVHDLTRLLSKFEQPKRSYRTMAFYLFDHIAGVDTMLHTLSAGGCLVIPPTRSPDSVLGAVETARVELLPVSPTFINLALLSESWTRFDLGSLKTVSYGAEPMPQTTLDRLRAILPDVRLVQTFGMTEAGGLPTKSLSSESLWLRFGDGLRTRIVDGILQIKSESTMLGYLNAASPFTDDGWLITGDRVETDGQYVRFLGRESEIINVGGEKVYPAEVEGVIEEVANVVEATVTAEKNPITGQVVCATVRLLEAEDRKQFNRRLRAHCRARLAPFKRPARIRIVDGPQHSIRFKKQRAKAAS
jgi:acyl-CoA synthetase (AMP-forming)/AMP-acid ligase II